MGYATMPPSLNGEGGPALVSERSLPGSGGAAAGAAVGSRGDTGRNDGETELGIGIGMGMGMD